MYNPNCPIRYPFRLGDVPEDENSVTDNELETVPPKQLLALVLRRVCCGRFVITREDLAEAKDMKYSDHRDEYGNFVIEETSGMGS